ncbi:MAG: glycosyltransferase family 4 protein [Bdellovibrionales bacterium]|nr:glycosyltransferase family 4 protein [Bdellovibrionales bacterium]
MSGPNSLQAPRLAFVLPRYGKSIGGGAETLAGEIARRYAQRNIDRGVAPGVEVLTTCARDHRTWANYYEPSTVEEDNLVIRRFPVDERDLEKFIHAEIAVRDGRTLTLEEQLDWLAHSVNSRELYRYILAQGASFDALLFAPYLFATSFWGALIHPEKSILIPCLHDEPYAYFPVFQPLFRSVRGIICNAEPERTLVTNVFSGVDKERRTAVVGMGFDSEPLTADSESRQRTHLLFSGRKETGKNLDLLLEWYRRYRESAPNPVDLVLIGAGEIDFLDQLPEGVKDYGFVSEAEKLSLMRSALCLCQPSVNESFSIVLMEAWLQGTPVIVHADCAVTRHHAVVSGGGLYAGSAAEFSGAVRFLVDCPAQVEQLGAAGRRYVENEYNWTSVLRRFDDALAGFATTSTNSLVEDLPGGQ